ncbi:MAG: ribonuclease HII [Chitinophagales bacterium]
MSLLPYLHSNLIEAGCDEAGRGCLAGPVFAAAVILPKDFTHPKLDDSKKINEKNRLLLREVVEREALAYAVGICSAQEIDEINILNASFEAMHRALKKLSLRPEMILVDGNRFKPFPEIQHECIVKGDSKYFSIAAASILAKTYRDDFMQKIHLQHPQYDWNKNKGYPTKAHRKAIEVHGSCAYHRQSFRLLPSMEKIK